MSYGDGCITEDPSGPCKAETRLLPYDFALTRCKELSAKEACTSANEQYVFAKESQTSAEEP